MSSGRHSNEAFIAFQATKGAQVRYRCVTCKLGNLTRNKKPSGFVRYCADIPVPARILIVLKASLSELPGRPFLRAVTGIAALAIAVCAITPADASLSRRMKFRAEQDAKKNVGPLIPPGQLHIMVSIKSQRVAVYSDGMLAVKSNVSTGVPDHPTPTGVFSVIQKNRHHRSNIYSDAPMPFMQRITWSGIAMHQGNLPGRPASHGCIRVSGDFAQLLWKRTRLGARVIVTRDEFSPYPFSHPKLFAPRTDLRAERRSRRSRPRRRTRRRATRSNPSVTSNRPATSTPPMTNYPCPIIRRSLMSRPTFERASPRRNLTRRRRRSFRGRSLSLSAARSASFMCGRR